MARCHDAIQQLLALDEEGIRGEQLQGQPQIGDRLGKAVLARQQPCAVQEHVGVGGGSGLKRGLESVDGPRRLAAVGEDSGSDESRQRAVVFFQHRASRRPAAAASLNREARCRAIASPTPTDSASWPPDDALRHGNEVRRRRVGQQAIDEIVLGGLLLHCVAGLVRFDGGEQVADGLYRGDFVLGEADAEFLFERQDQFHVRHRIPIGDVEPAGVGRDDQTVVIEHLAECLLKHEKPIFDPGGS